MKTHNSKMSWLVLAATISLVATGSGWALGFRNPDQGARATGQGEAFVAQADDASAIYYNPAGLTQQAGTELTSGSYFDFAGSRMNGALNNTSTSFLPQFYLATDFGKTNSPWRVGLGLNVPFGSKADLTEHNRSSLTVYNIAPSVAYRFNEHFSLGVDLNVYHGDTVFEEQGPATGGAVLRFQGGGNAVGATVGALYKFNDQHTVGVTYRSPFSIDFGDHAVLQPGVPATPASATINFPQSVAVGYAFRPVAKLKLEVDVEWTNWDPLNTVQLHAGPLHPALPYNWKDSFFYEFGAQYELTDRWTARAGYIFSENSVPDSTFSPALPDGNRHVLSAGAGCRVFKQLQVDAVYQYSFTESRTVAVGGPYDGKWTSDGHAIMITSTLHF